MANKILAEAMAKQIGVELNKPFKIRTADNNKLTDDECVLCDDGSLKVQGVNDLSCGLLLYGLLQGEFKAEAVPTHFKPADGDSYYYVLCSANGQIHVDEAIFHSTMFDYENISLGNYYRSEKAALEAAPRYIESLKDKYKITIGKLIKAA